CSSTTTSPCTARSGMTGSVTSTATAASTCPPATPNGCFTGQPVPPTTSGSGYTPPTPTIITTATIRSLRLAARSSGHTVTKKTLSQLLRVFFYGRIPTTNKEYGRFDS